MATLREIAGEMGFALPPWLGINPEDVPVLDAYVTSPGEMAVWCRHCRDWHRHGNYEGHRLAHCSDNTGYSATGYVLRRKGQITPAIQRSYEQGKEGEPVRDVSPRTRFLVLQRDGFRCRLCGRTADDSVKLEVDHRQSLSMGGTNDPVNLWTLCFDCNRGKAGDSL